MARRLLLGRPAASLSAFLRRIVPATPARAYAALGLAAVVFATSAVSPSTAPPVKPQKAPGQVCSQVAAAANSGPERLSFFVHIPKDLDPAKPAQVLVALHGMGGTGEGMAALMLPEADKRGWIVVAPNFPYSTDWRDPDQVRKDDLRLIPALRHLLDELPSHIGVPVRDRYLLYGFSRGGQIAQRFAIFYPESTLAAAVLSPGTYTLPQMTQSGERTPMAFPYGVADLEQQIGKRFNAERLANVQFLVAVGANDNVNADVPRQWDALLGRNRVERAQGFYAVLTRMGIDAQLHVFPNTPHELSGPMRSEAIKYLDHAVLEPKGDASGCIRPASPLTEAP